MIDSNSNELFIKSQLGDKQAFELLFKKLFPRLNDYARKLVKDDQLAQDLVQEVFIKLWEKRALIKPINIESFLFKALKNQCINHLKYIQFIDNRKVNLIKIKGFEELYRIDFIRDEPYQLIEKELQFEIDKLINSLPKRCKEVFMMSRYEGLKNREIAEKLGIHIKNVEKHITKALTIFKKYFIIN
ncbi:RNA polymerase sigma-70 factor [Bacteroidota bacterium]